MPKWIGRVFGNPIATTDNIIGQKGIFDISDRLYFANRINATGGTIVDDAGYRMHIFTSPGSFVVFDLGNSDGTVEYLVVAGGAGGSWGGGGAGGLRTATGFPITTTTYPITVGAGGDAVPSPANSAPRSPKGNPSVFSTITSEGGGGAGAFGATLGRPGGSGGGGGTNGGSGGTGNTPPVSPSQGNPGGSGGPGQAEVGGGGGGGAGGIGSNAAPPGPSINGGPGGVGYPITWIPTSYGTPSFGAPAPAPGRYFAGGGGGARNGAGGAGGGGDGKAFNPAESGTVNTGGGGGAADGNAPGSGGSGIVVIRYPI